MRARRPFAACCRRPRVTTTERCKRRLQSASIPRAARTPACTRSAELPSRAHSEHRVDEHVTAGGLWTQVRTHQGPPGRRGRAQKARQKRRGRRVRPGHRESERSELRRRGLGMAATGGAWPLIGVTPVRRSALFQRALCEPPQPVQEVLAWVTCTFGLQFCSCIARGSCQQAACLLVLSSVQAISPPCLAEPPRPRVRPAKNACTRDGRPAAKHAWQGSGQTAPPRSASGTTRGEREGAQGVGGAWRRNRESRTRSREPHRSRTKQKAQLRYLGACEATQGPHCAASGSSICGSSDLATSPYLVLLYFLNTARRLLSGALAASATSALATGATSRSSYRAWRRSARG